MIVADGAEELLARAGLGTVGRVLLCMGDHVVAWSRSTDTVRVGPETGNGEQTLYVKRYHVPKWSRRLRSITAGRDRARREYDQLRSLQQRGLPVVRALATGARRRWGTLRSCFLITEGFDASKSLDQWATGQSGPAVERRALITAVARALSALHAAGVIHGQLFRRNVLVRREPSGRYDVRFLDFAPSAKRGRCGGQAAGDLGALGSGAKAFCSRTDMTRFLRAYLGSRRLSGAARELMREAARIGERFETSEQRRSRMARLFEETRPGVSSTSAVHTAMSEEP